MQLVYSSTKAVFALVMNMLIDRGLLNYEDKVTKYWPEFGQGGKDNVTILDLLTHRAGLVYIDEPIALEKLADLDYVAKKYAEQKHNFNSERVQAYHALSYGFPINEVIRRVDPKKRTAGQFIKEELNKPLGTEFYVGLTNNEVTQLWPRFTKFKDSNIVYHLLHQMLNFNVNLLILNLNRTLWFKAVSVVKMEQDANTKPDFYKVEIGGSNGLTNADSMARIASAMSQKGIFNGVRIMKEETWTKVMELNPPEKDQVLNIQFTRTNGGYAQFKLGNRVVYGWAGYGGSLIAWDPVKEIGFGYVMNAGKPDLAGGRARSLFEQIQNIVYD